MQLSQSIKIIPGVGPRRYQLLKKLGIETFKDLIFYYPRTYRDFSMTRSIKSCRIGDDVIIKAKVVDSDSSRTRTKKMSLTKLTLVDEEGVNIKAVWFNQSYIVKNLPIDSTWYFAGKIGFDFSTKEKTINSPDYQKKPIILPIYSETEGVNSKYLAKIIRLALSHVEILDWLPATDRVTLSLSVLQEAVYQIHFPDSKELLLKARQRLAFNELFFLSLKLQLRKHKFQQFPSCVIGTDPVALKDIKKALPFTLTASQDKALSEILDDLAKKYPMTRLLNGDVGSGKTIVAAIASLIVAKNHYQAVWLAPTEILATQHYQTITKLFSGSDVSVGLFTAHARMQTEHKARNTKHKALVENVKSTEEILQSDIIIGTHALIQDKINFKKLGLVVVDEEHRFGVAQRATLLMKDKNLVPHYLSMTATPIPRTLATAFYADFDVSIIDELPKGRKKIATRVVAPGNRQKAYDFIRAHIKNGRQCFVVCPLIDEQNNISKTTREHLFEIEKKSVKGEYEKLAKQIFPEFKVGMLHGRMSSEDKKQIMHDFSKNKLNILVSTSVIEVGVDIPNANIMMIEGADRFGLAQLHQFRGRVGRGVHQSFCFLLTDNINDKSQERLEALEKNDNGFSLAQIDLMTRGPGEFIGARQSGFASLKIAHLTDTITLTKAKKFASKVINTGLDEYQKILDMVKPK